MTTLAQYERARAALAEATKIDHVLPILDEVEHVKLYARQIESQELLAEATEFQMRAERRLGIIIRAAKEAGHFREGRRPKVINGSSEEPFPSVTLEEVGVGKKLSARSQKQASIAEQAFELMVSARREKIAAGLAKRVKGATAIAPGRHEPTDSADYFPTPPYATRALIERVFPQVGARADCRKQSAWEPACGAGHMAEVLEEYFASVLATDKYEYGYGFAGFDFVNPEKPPVADADWIISNPPFGDLTEQFVLRALDIAKVGVAMFVRLQWLETIGRYERLFKDKPPTLIAFFCERVALAGGHYDPDGGTATAYIWLVWLKRSSPRPPFWIPPGCKLDLTKPDDAERFTAHPVIRRPRTHDGAPINHDPSTGEITEPAPAASPAVAIEPAAESPSPQAAAASSCLDEEVEVDPIPSFCRRNPDGSFVNAGRVE